MKAFTLIFLSIIFFTQCRKVNNTSLTNPNPKDGSINVYPDILQWNPCQVSKGNPVIYYIYFSGHSIKVNENFYKISDHLCPFTKYNWVVTATDKDDNFIMLKQWSFTTGSKTENPIVYNPNLIYNSFSDIRDGKVYKTIQIGTQIWMAQNLDYNAQGSIYYLDNPKLSFYGRFYTWELAMNSVPDGWHIPSKEELSTMMAFVGSSISDQILEAGTTHWINNSSENNSGLTIIPSGDNHYSPYGNFHSNGLWYSAKFWTSSENMENNLEAYNFVVWPNKSFISKAEKTQLYTIRCIKNN